jgi:multicomponent Na+:H+ antiporter subunit E
VVPVTGERLLVPVSDSNSLRNTVAHVLQEGVERGGRGTSAVHFVYPLAERVTSDPDSDELEAARTLLERVAVWAEEDLDEDTDAVSVETAVIGTREYLFSPGDYADVIVAYAREHDLDVAVFDPEYDPLGTAPLLPPLEAEIERLGLDVEQAPVQRERRSPLLVRRSTGLQFLALFGISYLFYLALAGSVALFELATGAISGVVVATTLWGISLTTPVRPLQGLRTVVRFVLYVPYLLWEVLKANLVVAYVVLHPDLPIDPEMVEFDAAVWSVLPVATLANSITLTPGTLTVDVSRRHFTVHTLTRGSRDGLLSGSLERAVRFVFYGLRAARIQSPIERRDEQSDADERETP